MPTVSEYRSHLENFMTQRMTLTPDQNKTQNISTSSNKYRTMINCQVPNINQSSASKLSLNESNKIRTYNSFTTRENTKISANYNNNSNEKFEIPISSPKLSSDSSDPIAPNFPPPILNTSEDETEDLDVNAHQNEADSDLYLARSSSTNFIDPFKTPRLPKRPAKSLKIHQPQPVKYINHENQVPTSPLRNNQEASISVSKINNYRNSSFKALRPPAVNSSTPNSSSNSGLNNHSPEIPTNTFNTNLLPDAKITNSKSQSKIFRKLNAKKITEKLKAKISTSRQKEGQNDSDKLYEKMFNQQLPSNQFVPSTKTISKRQGVETITIGVANIAKNYQTPLSAKPMRPSFMKKNNLKYSPNVKKISQINNDIDLNYCDQKILNELNDRFLNNINNNNQLNQINEFHNKRQNVALNPKHSRQHTILTTVSSYSSGSNLENCSPYFEKSQKSLVNLENNSVQQTQNNNKPHSINLTTKSLYAWNKMDCVNFLTSLDLQKITLYLTKMDEENINGRTFLTADVTEIVNKLWVVDVQDRMVLTRAIMRVRNRGYLREYQDGYKDKLMYEYKM